MGLELFTLPNGVRVALDPMPGLGTAALGVWQRVGARWENAQNNGVAHLFEHMAFKGAGARDARQFAEAIEAVGGIINAGTGYERTNYYARILAEHAPFALDMIADILFAPHWAPDELEKEKGVVAQERGEAYDAPDDHVFELHQSALYPDQPLGRPILGSAETLANVSLQSLIDFRDAHMTPERTVIAIAGAFDRDAFLETAQARFGALAAKPAIIAPPARAASGSAGEVRKLEQTHLVFSWPAPPAGDDRLYAARLMAEIFGGGMASRLFQEVRETRGLVYAIDSFLDTVEDDGRLVVYAGCSPGNAKAVAEIVVAELHRLADSGVRGDELARAKAVAQAQMLMGAEAPSARAEARAGQVFLRGRVFGFEEARTRIAAVTGEQIQAIARAALAGPACAAVLGPKAGHGALAAFHAN
ncbi:MAG: insulinase family protein [Terricaulis sp.]|nr:insulinase family protein [Terricaulis sp.]